VFGDPSAWCTSSSIGQVNAASHVRALCPLAAGHRSSAEGQRAGGAWSAARHRLVGDRGRLVSTAPLLTRDSLPTRKTLNDSAAEDPNSTACNKGALNPCGHLSVVKTRSDICLASRPTLVQQDPLFCSREQRTCSPERGLCSHVHEKTRFGHLSVAKLPRTFVSRVVQPARPCSCVHGKTGFGHLSVAKTRSDICPSRNLCGHLSRVCNPRSAGPFCSRDQKTCSPERRSVPVFTTRRASDICPPRNFCGQLSRASRQERGYDGQARLLLAHRRAGLLDRVVVQMNDLPVKYGLRGRV
jgi:hypothetical protein